MVFIYKKIWLQIIQKVKDKLFLINSLNLILKDIKVYYNNFIDSSALVQNSLYILES